MDHGDESKQRERAREEEGEEEIGVAYVEIDRHLFPLVILLFLVVVNAISSSFFFLEFLLVGLSFGFGEGMGR